MQVDNRTKFMCGVLQCGYDDLVDIDNMNIDFESVIRECIDEHGTTHFNTFMRVVFDRGIVDLKQRLFDRIMELEALGELTKAEKDEFASLRQLDPDNDVECYFNFAYDTHISFKANEKVYRAYLEVALDEFADTTGYEIEGE